MCFTINIHTTRNAIENRFNATTKALKNFEFSFVYSAFSNPLIPVITHDLSDQLQLMSWGLIPKWTKDSDQAELIRKGTYNARMETLHQKPAFRDPYNTGRCLIIANGFYEWQHLNGEKIPWFIHLYDTSLFAFAGLFDSWVNPQTGISEYTVSIITAKANSMMEKIHNSKKRMPVILNPANEAIWLDNSLSQKNITELLSENLPPELNAYTIGKEIAKQTRDPNDPSLLTKVDYYHNGSLF